MNENEQNRCPSNAQCDWLTFIAIYFFFFLWKSSLLSRLSWWSYVKLKIFYFHFYCNFLCFRRNISLRRGCLVEEGYVKLRMGYSHFYFNFLCFSGNLLLRQGRRDEAMQSYESAIHYRPTLAVAYVNLALALHEAGLVSRAESVLVKCTQLDGSGLKDPRSHEAAKSSARQQLEKIRTERAKAITTSEPSTATSESVSQTYRYETSELRVISIEHSARRQFWRKYSPPFDSILS